MNLKKALQENKPAIVNKWFEAVIGTYQEQTRQPLRKTAAQFTNPVGFNIAEGLNGLFDALLQEVLPDSVSTFLDAIIRIRSVQDFSPSEALAFIFQLKSIVREELGREVSAAPALQEELTAFDRVVDDLGLFGFDLYMRCREKIYDLKAQEARSMTFRLLQKAQAIADHQE